MLLQKRNYWLRFAALLLVAVAALGLVGCSLFGAKETETKLDRDTIFWDQSLLSGVQRVTDDNLAKDWARISPDGTKLLYCETDRRVSRGDRFGFRNWNIVLLHNVRSMAKTDLVTSGNARTPAWSDNNVNFFYISFEDNRGILVRSSITAGGKTYVTRTPMGNDDDMPNIRRGMILGDTWRSGARQLVMLRENGQEQTFLGAGEQPSWHPTANKFVFVRSVSPSNPLKAIYEMNLDSNNQVTEIYRDRNNYNSGRPSYSACGRFILFQKGAEVAHTGVTDSGRQNVRLEGRSRWQIFIMKADGSSLTPLTTGNADVYSPSMDANGNVYFIADLEATNVFRARVNLQNLL
jgi:TolB protein